MATTAREACGTVCLLMLVKSSGIQLEMCLPGDCSAWEWDTDEGDGGERRGHCVLASGTPAARTDAAAAGGMR
jgi:hypothetical protein